MKTSIKAICVGLIAACGAFANWVPPVGVPCYTGQAGALTVTQIQYIPSWNALASGTMDQAGGYIILLTAEYGQSTSFRYSIDGSSILAITHAQSMISMLDAARNAGRKVMLFGTPNSCSSNPISANSQVYFTAVATN